MHAITRAAAALLAATAFAGITAGPVAAQDEAPWTVANDVGGDYSYTLIAGDRVDDTLAVTNHDAAPLNLAVYAADAFTTATGGLDLLTRDKPSTGVGAWVHPGTGHVTVPPGQTANVPFSVVVPADAPAGDHVGGILTALTEGGAERRLGIRVRLRVGGDLRPGLTVDAPHVTYAGTFSPFGTGDATLTYTIRNTGNAVVAARQSASVSGPFGSWRTAADPVPDTPRLLPGETWKVSVPVHGVTPAVHLTGTVTLVPLLTDAAGSTAPLPAADTSVGSWAIPWTLLALVVVLLGAAVFAIRRRRA